MAVRLKSRLRDRSCANTDLVAEHQQRELVFLLQRRHEVLRARDDVRFFLLHAAARVEREHDGDVLDRLLERLERSGPRRLP